MSGPVPSEIEFGWIYLPPSLLAVTLGLVVASIVAKILNETGYSRFFWNPPLAWLALVVIATSGIGLLILPP